MLRRLLVSVPLAVAVLVLLFIGRGGVFSYCDHGNDPAKECDCCSGGDCADCNDDDCCRVVVVPGLDLLVAQSIALDEISTIASAGIVPPLLETYLIKEEFTLSSPPGVPPPVPLYLNFCAQRI